MSGCGFSEKRRNGLRRVFPYGEFYRCFFAGRFRAFVCGLRSRECGASKHEVGDSRAVWRLRIIGIPWRQGAGIDGEKGNSKGGAGEAAAF